MTSLFARKPIAELVAEEGHPNSLKRELGAGDLIMLAIGAVIGAGIFGAIGTCPECGDHRFSGPITIAPATSLTCFKCGHVATVEDAVRTGLAGGTVKKLSDHRVVQNNPERA